MVLVVFTYLQLTYISSHCNIRAGGILVGLENFETYQPNWAGGHKC